MRPTLALALFGLSIVCSGCALVEDGGRNFAVAMSSPIDTHREHARNKQWAEEAWEKTAIENIPRSYTVDYAQGFKDGYAEYLYRGGDGEPPLLAPARYRHTRYQTPAGYQAVTDWFAGYRHGAAVAHDSGARRWITGPTGLANEPHAIAAFGHPESEASAPTAPSAPSEPIPLPVPRKLPTDASEPMPPKSKEIVIPLPEIPVKPAPAPEPKASIQGIRIAPPAEPETPMPAPVQPEPKASIQGIRIAPPTEPESPKVQPKATIQGIHVPTTVNVETPAPTQPDPKATIKGITAIPTAPPETTMEPVRLRIRAITPAAAKE